MDQKRVDAVEKRFNELLWAVRLKAALFAFCVIALGLACFGLQVPWWVQQKLFVAAAFAVLVLPVRQP